MTIASIKSRTGAKSLANAGRRLQRLLFPKMTARSSIARSTTPRPNRSLHADSSRSLTYDPHLAIERRGDYWACRGCGKYVIAGLRPYFYGLPAVCDCDVSYIALTRVYDPQLGDKALPDLTKRP